MGLYFDLHNKTKALSVIGLGYVGLPLAVAFSRKVKTIGFDVNTHKIQLYQQGVDPTNELCSSQMQNSNVEFTSDATMLKEANFHIIAVPTPLESDNSPDLSYVTGACTLLGPHIVKGSIVVFESTVYPGVTEDVCIPILEKESNLKCGEDFKVGYSPERINLGDKVNTLETIVKVVSGMDEDSLEEIAKTYELVIEAGVHRASSIKVVEAMNTKWNALGFTPGLVGGHCISVDPYYLMYEADKRGYRSRLIGESRRLNNNMSNFVGEATIRQLILANKIVTKAKVAILGVTYKENTADIRNSKVADIINLLRSCGIDPLVVDPVASPEETEHEFDIKLCKLEDLCDLDCIVLAVPHSEFNDINISILEKMFGNYPNDEKILIDVKCSLDKAEVKEQGYRYWHM